MDKNIICCQKWSIKLKYFKQTLHKIVLGKLLKEIQKKNNKFDALLQNIINILLPIIFQIYLMILLK
jgi:hypothetical protein